MGSDRSRTLFDARRQLRYSALAFAIAFVVHGADHAIRGFTGDDHHAAWPGWFQLLMGVLTVLIAAVIVGVAFAGYRHAPLICALVGLGVGVFFLALHGLPAMGHITDSFVSAGSGARVTDFSWMTAAAGTISALVLGAIGLRAWLRARTPSSADSLTPSGQRE